MKTDELSYQLPKELIADKPASPRDSARLLFVPRNMEEIKESTFLKLPDFLKRGDLLILNETKVFPARIFGVKETGGKVEIVFLEPKSSKNWEVLAGGRLEDGQMVSFSNDFWGIYNKSNKTLKVNLVKVEVLLRLERFGTMPLPPYIKRRAYKADIDNYQTVFAKKIGSAAAPTAGLHFTKRLLSKLGKSGVEIEYITLHVGLGTFAPIKTERLEDHPIHEEYFEIKKAVAEKINRAKREGRRIIACGTTVVRALESAPEMLMSKRPDRVKKRTNLFIYPGFRFQIVDGIITNFHTPKSSLLALVFAFLGKEKTKKAYRFAIRKKYRLFSYGDGMLIT